MDSLVVGDGVVTVRVTTLKGASAGEYYVHELPSYYLDVGEPRGVWLGQGAAELGLSGEVDDEAFLHVMAGADPRQPELLLGRRFGDDSVRGGNGKVFTGRFGPAKGEVLFDRICRENGIRHIPACR